MAASSGWLLLEELLERSDPAFVDELRRSDDADRLAAFASSWFDDRRPQARRFLLEYLRRPLNAYRHEGLIKRLFKLAEKAGDDVMMAHFLALFDRSIRRRKKKRARWLSQVANSRSEANALLETWTAQGAEFTNQYEWRGQITVTAQFFEEDLVLPRGTAMPRGKILSQRDPRTGMISRIADIMDRLGLTGRVPGSLQEIPAPLRKKLEGLRLYSVHTRNYLRRRAWRYFRNLGKLHPERYVPAVVTGLQLYEDADMPDAVALLDNWGLIHILFHHSPVLKAPANGWTLAPEKSLSELQPAPAFASLWEQAPLALVDLLMTGKSRLVRQWALQQLRKTPQVLGRAPLDTLLALLNNADPEVSAMAAEALPGHPDLATLPPARWLEMIRHAQPAALDALASLVRQRVPPDAFTRDELIDLACSRPTPIARLGWHWLQSRSWSADVDCRPLTRLAEAQSAPLRPELVRWARGIFNESTAFQPLWVLDYLDSRHADVRTEGWAWLLDEARARDDIEVWQRLLESPYDDVRLKLIDHLEHQVAGKELSVPDRGALNADLMRLLWATVLLNTQRGSRHKPRIIGALVRRLNGHADEAPVLLPILKVALRSVRGPEWRAGLAGVVGLVEAKPDLQPVVQQHFPELTVTG